MVDSLSNAQQRLESSAQTLKQSSDYLAELSTAMNKAISSGNWDDLKKILRANPSELAQALAAPVQVERTALYPASNFGSQMAPLYTMLGLWIGSLLLASGD